MMIAHGEIPKTVHLIVWEITDPDQAPKACEDMYRVEDSQEARHTVTDEAFGLARAAGINLYSPMCRTASWIEEALRRNLALETDLPKAARRSRRQALRLFSLHREAIEMMDELSFGSDKVQRDDDPTQPFTKAPLVKGMLLRGALLFLLIHEREHALPFLRAIRDRRGVRHGDHPDPGQAVMQWPTQRTSMIKTGGEKVTRWDVCWCDYILVMNAYLAWQRAPKAPLTKTMFWPPTKTERAALRSFPLARR